MSKRIYKIYEENGHLGIMTEDGIRKTPAVYDEIQPDDDKYYHCRAFFNWDEFILETGETKRRLCDRLSFFRKMPDGKKVNSERTTIEDRELYDSIEEWEDFCVIYTYRNGKFGCKDRNGRFILPTEFDELILDNPISQVFRTRKGGKEQYFDWDGNEIRAIVQDKYIDQDKDLFILSNREFREIVESSVGVASDVLTFERKTIDDVPQFLREHTDVLPIEDAVCARLDKFEYEYNFFGMKTRMPSSEDDWKSALAQLEKIGESNSLGSCRDHPDERQHDATHPRFASAQAILRHKQSRYWRI